MGTTARRFFPYTTNWDGTDPSGGDVLKLDTAVNPTLLTASQSCDFGTSGSKEITVDPMTNNRTATGVNSALGWAINIAGSDGMDGTSSTKRMIPAGAWLFQGTIGSLTASLNPCTVGFYVYRVAASPSTTRTLLFSVSVNAGLVSLATNFTLTTASQAQIILEAGETIQVTYTLTCTGQVGGLNISLQMGDALTDNDLLLDLPSPGLRTYYPRDLADSGPVITDALARVVSFPRALADNGPQVTDSLARVWTGARNLADAGPQITDDLQRAVTFPRDLADSGPNPTDDLLRLVTFNRSLADDGPVPVDDLQRAWTGSRTLSDSGPNPVDSLARQVTYARTLEDDISAGAGGGTTIIKRTIFGLFD